MVFGQTIEEHQLGQHPDEPGPESTDLPTEPKHPYWLDRNQSNQHRNQARKHAFPHDSACAYRHSDGERVIHESVEKSKTSLSSTYPLKVETNSSCQGDAL